jgi:hypothetical protein
VSRILVRSARAFSPRHCILSSARQLSLDPGSCWVDSVALEGLLLRSATAPPDELLRNRFLALVDAAARHLADQWQWQSAADCYARGLETDQLVEGLHRAPLNRRPGRARSNRQAICGCRHGKQTTVLEPPAPQSFIVRIYRSDPGEPGSLAGVIEAIEVIDGSSNGKTPNGGMLDC